MEGMCPSLFNLGQLQMNRDNFINWPSLVELKKMLYAVWWKLPQTGLVADSTPHCMDLNSVSVRNELGNTPPILPPILIIVLVPLLILVGFCAESFSETHCVWTSDPWEQWNNSYLSLQLVSSQQFVIQSKKMHTLGWGCYFHLTH